jgi:hypothetical protein
MYSNTINTIKNLREACKLNNLELYLDEYISKYNKFDFSDDSGAYECSVKKIDTIYKLNINISLMCDGKRYCPYELVYNCNTIFEIFENEYVQQVCDYKNFKKNYDYYITDPDCIEDTLYCFENNN